MRTLSEVESKLKNVCLGNEDEIIELLRERNEILGGNPNKHDHQLVQEYYGNTILSSDFGR